MTEKIQINDREIILIVEPHPQRNPGDAAQEFFTATYQLADEAGQTGAVLLLDENKAPVKFSSPVQAIEYASEKLLGLI